MLCANFNFSMEVSRSIFWSFPVLLVLCAIHGNGLEIRNSLEGSCAGMSNSTTQEFIDLNWMSNTRRWYVMGGNKFHMYRAVIHHFHDVGDRRFSEMSEHEFYYDSCFQINTPPNDLATMTGFEVGRRSLYNLTLTDVTPVPTLRIPVSPYVRGSAPIHITLTDNRTFYLYTMCFLELDQKGWGISTTVPELSDETIHEIEEHLVGLGFDREQFVFFRYNSCKPGVLNQTIPPRSDPVPTRPPSTPTTSSTRPPTSMPGSGGNMGWDRMSRNGKW